MFERFRSLFGKKEPVQPADPRATNPREARAFARLARYKASVRRISDFEPLDVKWIKSAKFRNQLEQHWAAYLKMMKQMWLLGVSIVEALPPSEREKELAEIRKLFDDKGYTQKILS